jgi:hypothetical protein
MFVATALAALLLTIELSPALGGSVGPYVPVFVVTTLIVVLIGFPQFLLAQYLGQTSAPVAIAAGMVTGAALPLAGALSEGTFQAWPGVAAYAHVSAAGGLTFFLVATAPRSPRRNAAAIFALTAVSITAALLIRPHLS